MDDIIAMSNTMAAIGGGGMLVNDYEILLGFFEKNYDVKDQWRLEEAIISID